MLNGGLRSRDGSRGVGKARAGGEGSPEELRGGGEDSGNERKVKGCEGGEEKESDESDGGRSDSARESGRGGERQNDRWRSALRPRRRP